MPRYTYRCESCKETFDTYSTVADRDKSKPHDNCLGMGVRDFGAELKGSKVDSLMKENERWSWSMGVHIHQIPEMMKKYPGSEYHPKTGQLKIKNRAHKLNEMKRRGFKEYV